MAKLNVPSLQHLARNWQVTPDLVRKHLVNLALNPPTISYRSLYGALHDMLVLKVPYEQVAEGISRKIHRVDLRENLLEILPLIRDYFDGITPDFVQTVARSHYPIRQGLIIPFEPPLVYGINGQLVFPWFSFWRSNPLAGKKLSLFITIVEEMLLQNPDLEEAKFQIIDLSIPAPKKPRELRLIDAKDIPRLSQEEMVEMLRIYAEGFIAAQTELEKKAKENVPREEVDPRQFSFL